MAVTRLEAAVFDIDGMLLDTKEFIFQAYEYAFSKQGRPVPDRKAIAAVVGHSLQECMITLDPKGDIEALSEAHNEFQDKNLNLVASYDGLHVMLDKLKTKGLKLAAWSSRYKNLVPTLKQAGIYEFFNVVVQGDEVTKHKPDPEGLLRALKELGVRPERAAMLGDAVMDIKAGKAAKVALTIGITHGFGTREDLEKVKPDYIVDSLAEIPPLLLNK